MFSSIHDSMIGVVSNVVSGAGAVQAYILPPLGVCITIYLIIFGYSVIRGVVQEPWGSYLATVAKVGILYGLVAGTIGGAAAEGVVALPELASGWVGADDANPGAKIDAFINNVSLKVAAGVEASDDWTFDFGLASYTMKDPIVRIISWLPILTSYILGAIIILYVIFLKFALAVTALFGPLFLAALVFEVTRGAFFTWLGAVLSYSFSIAVLYVVINLIFATLIVAGDASFDGTIGAAETIQNASSGVLTTTNSDAAALQMIAITAVQLLGIGFVMQAQSIAQGFTGGGGGSGAAVANAILPSAYTVRSLGRSIGGGGRSAGRGAVGVARHVGRAGKSATSVMRGKFSKG